jgi:hypothetical protein
VSGKRDRLSFHACHGRNGNPRWAKRLRRGRKKPSRGMIPLSREGECINFRVHLDAMSVKISVPSGLAEGGAALFLRSVKYRLTNERIISGASRLIDSFASRMYAELMTLDLNDGKPTTRKR